MDSILILSCLDGEKVEKWQEMEFSFHFLYVLNRCVTQLYRVNKSARQIADSNKKTDETGWNDILSRCEIDDFEIGRNLMHFLRYSV